MSGKPLVGYDEAHAPKKPSADNERFPKRRQPAFMAWFGEQKFPCVAAASPVQQMGKCAGVVERAHLKSRGAGGEDVGNVIPACGHHHRMLHRIGQRMFEFQIERKLKPIARKIGSAFLDFLSGKTK